MRKTLPEESQESRRRIGPQSVISSIIGTLLSYLRADPAQHVVVADWRQRQPAEPTDPEITGAHAEHSQPRTGNLVEFDGGRHDLAKLAERNTEIYGKALVRERTDAYRLVIDAAHSVVQCTNVSRGGIRG